MAEARGRDQRATSEGRCAVDPTAQRAAECPSDEQGDPEHCAAEKNEEERGPGAQGAVIPRDQP
jgi:hypothetical protein